MAVHCMHYEFTFQLFLKYLVKKFNKMFIFLAHLKRELSKNGFNVQEITGFLSCVEDHKEAI